MSANLRAFLAVIRWCEGTSDVDGYRALYGHLAARPKLFSDFADHPRQYFDTPWGKTSAAGAYQFLAGTWDDARAAIHLPDFGQDSQDRAAVWLIQRRGALEDVEAGRLDAALAKCGKEWASLPGSPYGQPTRTLADCRRVYLAAGGQLSDSQPAGNPPPRPSAPQPLPADAAPAPAAPDLRSPEERAADANWDRIQQERAMPLPAAAAVALGAELLKLLPMFSSGSKVAERNVAAAQQLGGRLLEIAKETAGTTVPNEQAAVEAVMKNPQLQQQFVAKAVASWSDLQPALEFEHKEREAARSFVAAATAGESWRAIGAGILIGTLSVTIIVGGGAMFWSLMDSPQLDPGQKGLILGALLSVFSSTAAFWFGSSRSSQVKDATIAEQARR